MFRDHVKYLLLAAAMMYSCLTQAATDASVAPVNRAPTISGVVGNGTVGAEYYFRPTASDPEGDRLTFSISGAPGWMVFRPLDGRIVGTPTDAGTYTGIVISVRDSAGNVASLPPATVTISGNSAPTNRVPTITGTPATTVPVGTGIATVSWTPPTKNADGTALRNLAGYRIAYGTSATELTQVVEIANPGLTSYTIRNLSPGTYYFIVRAYTSGGAESANSKIARKIVK